MASFDPTNTFDSTPVLKEAKHKLLNVTVNGLKLRSQDIIDIQVNYNDIIKGRITFVDTMNLTELAPLTYALIFIELIDINDNKISLDCIMTSLDVLRLKNNQINVTMKFEDYIANTLSNTFISKAYSDKSMLEIYSDLIEMAGGTASYYMEIDDKKIDNIVTPANMSVLDFIMQQNKFSNILMFSDRDGIHLSSRKFSDFGAIHEPTEFDFTLNSDPKYPHWNILEYNGKVSNFKSTQRAVNANRSMLSIKDLKYDPEEISAESAYESQNVNSTFGMGDLKLPDLVESIGSREISHLFDNELIGKNIDYRDIINKQQQLTVAIQGLNITRMYTKIKLVIPRAQSVQTQESDEVFSAVYVVTGVIDKLIAGNFFQFLELSVADYSAGNPE